MSRAHIKKVGQRYINLRNFALSIDKQRMQLFYSENISDKTIQSELILSKIDYLERSNEITKPSREIISNSVYNGLKYIHGYSALHTKC